MAKTVVLTGCLGFIGRQVLEDLLRAKYNVIGIDKQTYASSLEPAEVKNNYFKFIKADIAKLKRLPDCDFVINVAAESHVGNSIIKSDEFVQSNVEGVRNLLELIRNKPVNYYGRPKFIHFSTDEVYGDIVDGSFSEENPLNPSNPYSASKAAGDMFIKAWARTYNIDYKIIRPTNNYGFYQFSEKLIPLSVKLLNAGKKIHLHNEGEPVRSWLSVWDTSSAVLFLLENGKWNNIYNVGGEEYKNIDVVREIINQYFDSRLLSEKEELSHIAFDGGVRKGQDVRYSVCDDKLRSLGWEPKYNLMRQLRTLVEHYKHTVMW